MDFTKKSFESTKGYTRAEPMEIPISFKDDEEENVVIDRSKKQYNTPFQELGGLTLNEYDAKNEEAWDSYKKPSDKVEMVTYYNPENPEGKTFINGRELLPDGTLGPEDPNMTA